MRIGFAVVGAVTLGLAPLCWAEQTTIEMHMVGANGIGDSIGTVTAEDSADGLTLRPDLAGLPPGVHGFHVHEKASCEPGEKDGEKQAALAAGGHHDPQKTGKHAGPSGQGHLGDLPALTVENDGKATKAVIAPRLDVADLKGRSLMIHAGGDNYADEPEPLGGGGKRIACGVVGQAG